MPERAAATRVLIADDHTLFVEALEAILATESRIEVVGRAQDGAQAVDLAASLAPDVVLMDISIPIIDGWEATQVLKHDPDTNGIPIIALTAHALPEDREKSASVGCDGYLAKPCEPSRVLAEVKRVLGISATAA